MFKQKLIQKYQELADHTKPECGACPRIKPHGCCREEHCRTAQRFAKERWEVDLPETGHPSLPFMSLDGSGCTLAPHLRPACTFHTCEMNAWGVKQGDQGWTEKYYQLYGEIVELEYKLWGEE